MLPVQSRLLLPIKKAIEETSHGDIVSSEQTQFLNGINSPFHTEGSTISVKIVHLNFRALIDTGAAVTAVSARVWQRCASNISLNLGPPNHDSITTVDRCLLKVIGRVMLPFVIGSKIFPFEAHVIQDMTSDVILGRNFFEKFCAKNDFDEGWPSGESTCLPPMWPGFDFHTRRHIWVEFVGSLLCYESFSPGYSGFPLSPKTNI